MNMRMICIGESLLDGPGYLIFGESYRVGRSSHCSFVVSDLSVSRYHAEVTVNLEKVRVKDLGSRNGTYVDGVRVNEVELQPGQSVRFGTVQFQITGHDESRTPDQDFSDISTFFVENKPFFRPATLKRLSEAQRRVLDELLLGLSEKEVATKLDLSPHTVHNHVKEVYRRMSVSSRAELLALFVHPKNPDTPGR
jgi:pSer/pThr/pTyr-binding forkhead associated (FHA) protein